MMPDGRQALLSRPRCWAILFVVLLVAATGLGTVAQPATEAGPGTRGSLIGGIAILVLATAASGWYFGRPVRKVPFLLGIAAFGAACGIGIGFTSKEAFASLVAALATAFGGALVCAVSTRAQPRKAGAGDMVSYASAASGIPLLLGVYFGSSLGNRGSDLWYGDVHRMVAVAIVLAVALAVGISVGRRTLNVPLSLGAATFGAFVGIATGFSRDPAVAYVAPAMLALLTGAASYAFTANPRERSNIGGILFCFGILVTVGLFLGSIGRVKLGWGHAPAVLFGFAALLLPSLALGGAVGAVNQDRRSGLGFAALGSAAGLAIGLSKKSVTWIVTPSLLAVLAILAIYLFSANRDDRKVFSRLVSAFAVVVLLSAFVGFSLREAAWPDLAIGAPPSTETFTALPGNGTTGATDPVGVIWLEGRATSSAVVIDVKGDLGGRLRVIERVDARVLYEGTPARGDPLRLSGESLEISWPASAARGALSIKGWDRMIEQGGKWTVTGDGEPVDLSRAEVESGRFVIVYPLRD